jgi:hypothetical protein
VTENVLLLNLVGLMTAIRNEWPTTLIQTFGQLATQFVLSRPQSLSEPFIYFCLSIFSILCLATSRCRTSTLMMIYVTRTL